MFLPEHTFFETDEQRNRLAETCCFGVQKLRAQGIHYTFVLCRCTGHKPSNRLPSSNGPFKLISTLNPR
jgi:hypothetical protein